MEPLTHEKIQENT